MVPSDCLAVHLAGRLPRSTELVLAFESAGGISRGTAGVRLRAPEAYTLTAHTAVACAERTLAGDVSPGYATPGTAYGPDFVLSIRGCAARTFEHAHGAYVADSGP